MSPDRRTVAERIAKHLPGRHNQKDHGRWARGGGNKSEAVWRDELVDRLKNKIKRFSAGELQDLYSTDVRQIASQLKSITARIGQKPNDFRARREVSAILDGLEAEAAGISDVLGKDRQPEVVDEVRGVLADIVDSLDLDFRDYGVRDYGRNVRKAVVESAKAGVRPVVYSNGSEVVAAVPVRRSNGDSALKVVAAMPVTSEPKARQAVREMQALLRQYRDVDQGRQRG